MLFSPLTFGFVADREAQIDTIFTSGFDDNECFGQRTNCMQEISSRWSNSTRSADVLRNLVFDFSRSSLTSYMDRSARRFEDALKNLTACGFNKRCQVFKVVLLFPRYLRISYFVERYVLTSKPFWRDVDYRA